MKRNEGESFNDFKIRRKEEGKLIKKHLKGRLVQLTEKELNKKLLEDMKRV